MAISFGENILNHSTRARWLPTRCRTIQGDVVIHGLGKACQGNDKGTYESVAFDDGRWKFLLHTSDFLNESEILKDSNRYLGVYLSACEDENEGTARKLTHEFDVQLVISGQVVSTFTCERNRFTPDGDGWGTKSFCRMNKLADNRDLATSDEAILHFTIREYPDDYGNAPLRIVPPFHALTDAYAQLFDDSLTSDVCFVIYYPSASKRQPQRIYAHSKILSARAEYFASLLQESSSDNTSARHEESERQWEDDPDSDYDDKEEGEEDEVISYQPTEEEDNQGVPGSDKPTTYVREQGASSTKDYESNVFEEGTQEKGPALHRDSPRANSVDEGVASTPGGSRRTSALGLTVPQLASPVRHSKIINVYDASYRTYHALLFYLYTGSIRFAPPASTYRIERASILASNPKARVITREEFNEEHSTSVSTLSDDSMIPWTSAKSMYKLCDRLDITELTEAATEHIRISLIPDTIAEEVSSKFSATYPQVRALQANYLEEHWAEVRETEGLERLFMRLFRDAGIADVWLNLFAKLTVRENEPNQDDDDVM